MAASCTIFQPTVFVLTFVSYALLRMQRRALSYVEKLIVSEWTPSTSSLNKSHGDPTWTRQNLFQDAESAEVFLGVLNAIILSTYAVGLYISGALADRLDKRLLLSVSMTLSAVVMFIFGPVLEWSDSYSQAAYLALNALHGLLQSIGWPCVVAIMGAWFSKETSKYLIGVWSTSASAGSIIAAPLMSSVLNFGYEYAFLLTSSLLFSGGVLVFFGLVPSPQEVGLAPPHDHADQNGDDGDDSDDTDLDNDHLQQDETVTLLKQKPLSRTSYGTQSECPHHSAHTYRKKESCTNGETTKTMFTSHDETPFVQDRAEPPPSLPTCRGMNGYNDKRDRCSTSPKLLSSKKAGLFKQNSKSSTTDSGQQSTDISNITLAAHEQLQVSDSKAEGRNLKCNKRCGEHEKQSTARKIHPADCTVHAHEDKKKGSSCTVPRSAPKAINMVQALLLPGVISYALVNGFVKMVSSVFFFWLPYLLSSSLGYPETTAASLSLWYDVGGMVGGIVTAFFLVKLDKYASIMSVILLCSLPLLYVFGTLSQGYDIIVHGILLFTIGWLIGGVSNIISATISSDIGHREAARSNVAATAMVAGIVEGTGTVGAIVVQLALPYLSGLFGWDVVFFFQMVAIALSVFCMLPTTVTEVKDVFRKRSEEATVAEPRQVSTTNM